MLESKRTGFDDTAFGNEEQESSEASQMIVGECTTSAAQASTCTLDDVADTPMNMQM